MGIHKPEIVELLLQVEQKYQKGLRTTTDFEEFSFYLSNQIGESISPSTLKRLWGYVNDNHEPRIRTLDLLARYLDYTNFKDFTIDLKIKNNQNSSFFSVKQLQTEWLSPRDEVEIGWSPNRYVKLLYMGNNLFKVIEALQTKLLIGDLFETTVFLQGHPLLVSYILRQNQKTAPFIAGRNGGLTLINTIKHA